MSEYIQNITLDEHSIKPRSQEVTHERNVAIADLIDHNVFEPTCIHCGPYDVVLSVKDSRLILNITGQGESMREVVLSMQPLRAIVRDYFMICESYFEAIKSAGASKLEAIDMARRGVHNEGAEVLKDMLKDRVVVDFATSRRLFTLICVLHIK